MFLDTKKVLQTTDFQRNYNWEFILPGSVSSVDNILVSSYIQDIKFGQYDFTELTTLRQGPFETHYAGPMKIEPITLSILSPSTLEVVQYFSDWRNRIVDDSGFYYPKMNYAFSSYCYLYDSAGNQMIGYKLVNTYPKTFPSYKLTYAGEGEIVKHDIEMSVDFIEQV